MPPPGVALEELHLVRPESVQGPGGGGRVRLPPGPVPRRVRRPRQLLPRRQDVALVADQRGGERTRGTGVQVRLALLRRGDGDGATKPDLSPLIRPVEAEGGIRAGGQRCRPLRLVACVANDQPAASAPCSITMRTSGRPSSPAVASDIVWGSGCPAATASANHRVNRANGSSGAFSGSKPGSSVSHTRSDLSSS